MTSPNETFGAICLLGLVGPDRLWNSVKVLRESLLRIDLVTPRFIHNTLLGTCLPLSWRLAAVVPGTCVAHCRIARCVGLLISSLGAPLFSLSPLEDFFV